MAAIKLKSRTSCLEERERDGREGVKRHYLTRETSLTHSLSCCSSNGTWTPPNNHLIWVLWRQSDLGDRLLVIFKIINRQTHLIHSKKNIKWNKIKFNDITFVSVITGWRLGERLLLLLRVHKAANNISFISCFIYLNITSVYLYFFAKCRSDCEELWWLGSQTLCCVSRAIKTKKF